MANIIVQKIRPVNGNGHMKAFVQLKIDETLFGGFRVIQKPGQKPWVSPPQESWTGSDGKPGTQTDRVSEDTAGSGGGGYAGCVASECCGYAKTSR